MCISRNNVTNVGCLRDPILWFVIWRVVWLWLLSDQPLPFSLHWQRGKSWNAPSVFRVSACVYVCFGLSAYHILLSYFFALFFTSAFTFRGKASSSFIIPLQPIFTLTIITLIPVFLLLSSLIFLFCLYWNLGHFDCVKTSYLLVWFYKLRK